MNTKHTPGPWGLEGKDILGPVDSAITGIPTKAVIAKVTSFYWGEDVAKADAHLIAAAPELLEALNCAPVHRLGESFAEFMNRYKTWYVVNRREAIAKAEGR